MKRTFLMTLTLLFIPFLAFAGEGENDSKDDRLNKTSHQFRPIPSGSEKTFVIFSKTDSMTGDDIEIRRILTDWSEDIRGDVARIFLNMAMAWDMHLIAEDWAKYQEWSEMDPATNPEKKLNRLVCETQGYGNNFVEFLIFNPHTRKCGNGRVNN